MNTNSRQWLGAIVLMTLSVLAQAASPFNDQPAGPQSLPGDLLPPFAMLTAEGELPLDLPPLPVGALPPQPGGSPESTAPGPSLADAQMIALAAVLACQRQGYRVGVAVVDSAGEARAMLTADGSDGSHVFVAMRKAEVALAFGMTSSAVPDLLRREPARIARVTRAMFVEGGAVPIIRGGIVIGALGVSGAAGMPIGERDETCAAAGLSAIGA